jgi:hypothetical protein
MRRASEREFLHMNQSRRCNNGGQRENFGRCRAGVMRGDSLNFSIEP